MNDYVATINFRLGSEHHTIDVPCKGYLYSQASDDAVRQFKESGIKHHEYWVRGVRMTKSRV
jgi:hypothetical protein